MRAVTSVVFRRPCDVSGIFYEVVAVFVVYITVVVGVFSGVKLFAFVYPNVVFQVRVGKHHSLVQYGNNNGGVSCAFLPRFVTAYVASLYGSVVERILVLKVVRTCIVVMPLIDQSRVCERSRCSAGAGCSMALQCRFIDVYPMCIGLVGALDVTISLHLGNFS